MVRNAETVDDWDYAQHRAIWTIDCLVRTIRMWTAPCTTPSPIRLHKLDIASLILNADKGGPFSKVDPNHLITFKFSWDGVNLIFSYSNQKRTLIPT